MRTSSAGNLFVTAKVGVVAGEGFKAASTDGHSHRMRPGARPFNRIGFQKDQGYAMALTVLTLSVLAQYQEFADHRNRAQFSGRSMTPARMRMPTDVVTTPVFACLSDCDSRANCPKPNRIYKV
jgi:hypothetical protein